MKKYFLIIILPLIFLRCNDASEDLNKWPEHLREEFLEKYMPTPNANPHGGLEDQVNKIKSSSYDNISSISKNV